MTIKKWKFFMLYTSEEKWLNDMSEKGLHLVEYKFGRYFFEKGEPGKYEYRLELLDVSPTSQEGKEYIEFMNDVGAECVDTFQYWAYFRKEATDEPFEIYTDAPSKIKHLNRVMSFLIVIALANGMIAVANMMNEAPFGWV